jgi:hypothetical protein
VIDKTAKRHDAELDLDKLLGFKRVAAFGNDQAGLARALDATYNKVGTAEGPPPTRSRRG